MLDLKHASKRRAKADYDKAVSYAGGFIRVEDHGLFPSQRAKPLLGHGQDLFPNPKVCYAPE